MELKDAVLKRRMVRNFTDEPVDREVVERMLDLARHAPSAGFTQGQSFVVVTDPEKRREIGILYGEGEEDLAEGALFHKWISKAPVLVVACTSEAEYHRRYQEPDKIQEDGTEIEWPVPYWHIDIGCAVMILLLAVVEEGLSAGYAGVFDIPALRGLLGIPEEVTPVGVIPIGHRAPDVPSPSLKRGRKAQGAYLHWEKW
jgi:nitroreductase